MLEQAGWVSSGLLMLLVGMVGIGVPELWRDELATWSAATRSVPQILSLASNVDGVHAPYYLVMHGWIAVFGDSAVSMRAPSLLAAAAAAGMVSLIGARLFGRWAGFLAGLIFVLVPEVSRMAQEARPYALLMFACALATFLLLAALDDPGWWRWLRYGAAIVLVGLTNMVALAILAGHLAVVFVVWWRSREQRLMRAGVVTAAALLALLPLLILGLGQQARQITWIPRPSLLALLGVDHPFAQGGGLWTQVFRSAPVAYAVLVLAALAWLRRDRAKVAAVTAVAVLPVLAIWVMSRVGTSY